MPAPMHLPLPPSPPLGSYTTTTHLALCPFPQLPCPLLYYYLLSPYPYCIAYCNPSCAHTAMVWPSSYSQCHHTLSANPHPPWFAFTHYYPIPVQGPVPGMAIVLVQIPVLVYLLVCAPITPFPAIPIPAGLCAFQHCFPLFCSHTVCALYPTDSLCILCLQQPVLLYYPPRAPTFTTFLIVVYFMLVCLLPAWVYTFTWTHLTFLHFTPACLHLRAHTHRLRVCFPCREHAFVHCICYVFTCHTHTHLLYIPHTPLSPPYLHYLPDLVSWCVVFFPHCILFYLWLLLLPSPFTFLVCVLCLPSLYLCLLPSCYLVLLFVWFIDLDSAYYSGTFFTTGCYLYCTLPTPTVITYPLILPTFYLTFAYSPLCPLPPPHITTYRLPTLCIVCYIVCCWFPLCIVVLDLTLACSTTALTHNMNGPHYYTCPYYIIYFGIHTLDYTHMDNLVLPISPYIAYILLPGPLPPCWSHYYYLLFPTTPLHCTRFEVIFPCLASHNAFCCGMVTPFPSRCGSHLPPLF